MIEEMIINTENIKLKKKRNNYRREPLPNRNRQEYNPVRYSSGNMKDKDNDYKHKDNR
jgi:hypothetical protein